MSKAWLVRPIPHGRNRMEVFKTDNIIAVGWPLIGDLTGKVRSDIKAILQGPPYTYSSLKLGSAYATIDILVNQMSKGDLILVPNNDDIYFGKIESDYIYDNSKDSDAEGYPHQRKIKWLYGPISRTQLPDELRTSLKVQRTTADLSKHYYAIKALSEGTDITSINLPATEEVFINVEYPIRPGVLVKLSIPKDMTQSEASRLGDFVKTLYFE
ncbi:restriction endonuclease [Desnuesiella massiliensis]|uniref:restriction endonuclease n=1 Tax=Desnuesiella massiliensis TaxID=1650662 RepID=UPI0006E2685E|nr:hypothetical protein [Desnuesiella massiliensis]